MTVFGSAGRGLLSAVLAFGTGRPALPRDRRTAHRAHEQPDTPVLTATFFVGFLVLLLLSFAT